MAQLNETALKLLGEGRNFATVATLMSDGSPQATVVWIDTDGENVVFNTALGRVKSNNLERDGRVAISVYNAENPYQQVNVRGHVIEMTTDGADEHIDKLAQRYLGRERYPGHTPNEQRVIVKVAPDQVTGMG